MNRSNPKKPGNGTVVFATLLGMGGWLGYEEFASSRVERVQLPGFSIEIPVGTVTETSTSPSGGAHKVDLKSSTFSALIGRQPSKPKVAVQWSAQSASREEWREVYLPIFTQAIAAATPGTSVLKEQDVDDQRWLNVVGKPDAPVGVGAVRCGDNFLVTVVMARFRDVDRQAEALEKVLRSVECAVTEANTTRLEAAVRLPASFGRTSDESIEAYRSLDGEKIVINFTNGDVQRDRTAYKAVAKALLATAFGTEVPDSSLGYLADPKLSRPTSLIRAQLPDSGLKVYVGTQYCHEHGQTLMFLWTAPEPDDALAAERLAQVGCPGDPFSPSPTFAEIAENACKAGDQAACNVSTTID